MIRSQWFDLDGNTWEHTDRSSPLIFSSTGQSGVEGLSLPELQSFVQPFSFADGQTVNGWRANAREVFWPLTFQADPSEWQTMRRQVRSGMRPGPATSTWRVTGPDGTYRELALRFEKDGTPAWVTDPSFRSVETWGVTFTADIPWWSGPQVVVNFQAVGDQLPFFATSSPPSGANAVFNLAPGNSTSSQLVDNPGEVDSWPLWVLNGPLTSFDFVVLGLYSIAGEIPIFDGEVITINTDPLVQRARLFSSDPARAGIVTDQLDSVYFQPIRAGSAGTSVAATLIGTGSAQMSFTPHYFEAV